MKKRTTKIEIPEITRVEGHEAVFVDIEGDKVTSVRLDVFEGTRFFEKLVVGHHFGQMPHITSRVCAICSTGHVIAAIRAVEKLFSFEPDETTELLRELMHLGMIIESNATHIYALALPDFLGFQDVYQFNTEHPEEFETWTSLRSFGATIQTTMGGRPFHPINLHAGGFSKYPSKEKLEEIRDAISDQKEYALKTAELLLTFSPPVKRTTEPVFLALEPSSSHYGYFGEKIRASNGFNASIEEYRDYLKEESVEYSHSKRSSFEGEPIMVGSLARLNLFNDRLKKSARKLYDNSPIARGDTNSIWNNLGQAIEIVEAMDRAKEILDDLIARYQTWFREKPLHDLKDANFLSDKPSVGAVECPRGTLYHEYTVDSEGLIKSANMITPTAQNTYRIERDIQEVVSQSIEGRKDEEIESTLATNLETLVRAYDPCNTCATHMVSVNYKKAE